MNVTLVIQDASQLVLHYGKNQADVILSIVGNIISGQVTGDSAKLFLNVSARLCRTGKPHH